MVGKILGGLFVLAIAPVMIPAYVITRLFGMDPFSLDGMGIDFGVMVVIAIIIAVAGGAFFLGTMV
jgi:hypothetical protein